MSEGTDPVTIAIPIGVYLETDLIAALDILMDRFRLLDNSNDGMGRIRAADWVQAKYGTPRP